MRPQPVRARRQRAAAGSTGEKKRIIPPPKSKRITRTYKLHGETRVGIDYSTEMNTILSSSSTKGNAKVKKIVGINDNVSFLTV
jgi:hypothetical protein